MSTTFMGQLEIDPERGVIYFHSSETGATLLRIQGLPNPISIPNPKEIEMLDIRLTCDIQIASNSVILR